MKHNLDENSFHDNLIHGIEFFSDSGELSSDIAFNIDYIEKWVRTKKGEILFVISSALLKFHEVTDLKILIDWGESNNTLFSGDAPGFYINSIKKEKIISPISDDSFLWTIHTSNQNNHIHFGAACFSLEFTGEQRTVNRQFLLKNER